MMLQDHRAEPVGCLGASMCCCQKQMLLLVGSQVHSRITQYAN